MRHELREEFLKLSVAERLELVQELGAASPRTPSESPICSATSSLTT